MFPRTTFGELFARQRTVTYNPNRPPVAATAPPVVVAADAEQLQRDVWFQELVQRCRAKHMLDATIALCLDECGRSRQDLDDAIEREESLKAVGTSPVANLIPVSEKEKAMSDYEKRQTLDQWNAAIQAKQNAHPQWDQIKCVSAVVKQDPGLHQRFLDAANNR